MRVGQTTTYTLMITNDRDTEDQDLVVRFTVPEGMRVQRFNGPLRLRSADADSRILEFHPIAEIRAGETLTPSAEFIVSATRAGDYRARAEVTSRLGAKPVTVEQPTTVIAP
jgi:uncharacterized repeat protein (TIGR01451 family)